MTCDLCRVTDDQDWIGVFAKLSSNGMAAQSVLVYEGLRGGATKMTQCLPGRFSASKQNAVCQDCPSGKFTTQTAAIECDACPPARYSEASSTMCHACVSGKFAPVAGSARCLTCGDDTFSHNESEACFKCTFFPRLTFLPSSRTVRVHSFLLKRTLASSSHHAALRTHTHAHPGPGRGVKCLSGTMLIEDGYWFSQDEDMSAETSMYPCPVGYCLGDAGRVKCKEGHTSRLCSICIPGYAKTGVECSECIDQWLGILMTVGLLLFMQATVV